MKSIFVSRVYEDNHYFKKLKKWEKDKLMDNYTFTCEKKDLRSKGYDVIRSYLKNMINGSAAVLVLVGDDTHNHDWIRVEIELAHSLRKPVICMRIPNTNGKRPAIIRKRKELNFDPNAVLLELN